MIIYGATKDEIPQPLTNEQMTDIKSQFHPSNTANVNIVPYEIYDEDGVEQVVGEVRKTIDGVKKKKPLYRVIVKGTTPSTSGDVSTELTGFDSCLLEECHIYTSWGNVVNIAFMIVDTDVRPDASAIYFDVRDNAVKRVPFMAILRCTKTIDTWQPV